MKRRLSRKKANVANNKEPFMFDRFTDKAREVMAEARHAAKFHGVDYIGTEHLLIGLLVGCDTKAHDWLRRCGVKLDVLRRSIEAASDFGSSTSMGQLPFTPRAKQVLERALDESSREKSKDIDTHHLLLALARCEDGLARPALLSCGVTEAALRAIANPPAPPVVGDDPPYCPKCGYSLNLLIAETTATAVVKKLNEKAMLVRDYTKAALPKKRRRR